MAETSMDVDIVVIPMLDHNEGHETEIVTIAPCKECDANLWSVIAQSKDGGRMIICDRSRRMAASKFAEAFRRQLRMSERCAPKIMISRDYGANRGVLEMRWRDNLVKETMTTIQPTHLEGDEAAEYKVAVEKIILNVFQLNKRLLHSRAHGQFGMRARHAMTLLLKWAPMTNETIGGLMHRDRTTVSASLSRAAALLEKDHQWRGQLAQAVSAMAEKYDGFNPHWDETWITYQELTQ
ncbi:MAG: hypothetical protein AAFV69_00090 [Pseudomonadota bacterium]